MFYNDVTTIGDNVCRETFLLLKEWANYTEYLCNYIKYDRFLKNNCKSIKSISFYQVIFYSLR